jgi:hypothetical protein
MAYEGGGLLSIWRPDLSTRPGAQAAMDSAKFGFLIVVAFRVVVYGIAAYAGGLFTSATAPAGLPAWVVWALLLLDLAIPLFAAWRLHLYQGAFVVPVATLLYVLGILLAPSIGAIVIGAIFTGVFVGGIRGAWALRRGTGFEDDHYTAFS